LTTCTYDGILFPVYEIARLAHDKGVLFYADEAWLPYGRFHPYYGAGPSGGRYNALDSGADFCVHSSHKALAAFSQASMIHIGQHFEELLGRNAHSPGFDWLKRRFNDFREFEHRLVENLAFWLSTSPHYPMIATLDCASAQMYMEGLPSIGVLLKHAKKLHRWAEENQCAVTKKDLTGTEKGYEWYGHDPLRFMVKVKDGGMEKLKTDLLMVHRQQWEKSSQRSLLFLVTLGTSESDLNMLIQSLEQCKSLLGSDNDGAGDSIPEITGQVTILPRDAHYAAGRYMRLSEIRTYLQTLNNDGGVNAPAAVACHMVTPFPPGVPTILPGLPITDSSLEWIEGILEDDGEVHGILGGAKDPQIRVLLDTDQELIDIRNSYKTNVEFGRALAAISQTDDAAK
jgi:arginine decarboxylase